MKSLFEQFGGTYHKESDYAIPNFETPDTGDFEYSYLHVVSDNLAVKYPYDLSNERKAEVLKNRETLLSIIGNAIMNI